MGQFFNYNSFLISIILIFLGVGVAILRRGRQPKHLAYLGGAAVLVLLVYFGIRPEAGTSEQAAEIEAQIGSGTPVLLEFQSQN
ncbi:MAG TPA: hypothetical protein VJ965_05935 [Anaerolineales bacterium]|nr:hypothetical protein [Anaerolineales bacterium]